MNKDRALHDYDAIQNTLELHLHSILDIVKTSGAELEGNSIYAHQTFNRVDILYTKQLNLFGIMTPSISNICEIGFNAGHSALLMLLGAKAPINLTVFDICEHPYTHPTYQYLRDTFPTCTMSLIEGDSTVTIPQWLSDNPHRLGSFDLIHVDGGHSEPCIRNDLANAVKLLKLGGLMIVDDTNISYINQYVDDLVERGLFQEYPVFPTQGYPHRVLQSRLKGDISPFRNPLP